jgi:hypothetical protein
MAHVGFREGYVAVTQERKRLMYKLRGIGKRRGFEY